MQDYFNSLTQISDKQDPSELLKELNIKMDELIKNEKFEEAARLRDYMYKKNIKRNSVRNRTTRYHPLAHSCCRSINFCPIRYKK